MTQRHHTDGSTKRFVADNHWHHDFLHHPLFNDLETMFHLSNHTAWPSIEWLNSQLSTQHVVEGIPIRFVADPELADDERYYEQIIFETGQIPTRLENWHDLFGAFIWLLFPKTKRLLNQLHIHEISEHGLTKRSKARNAITLFDECGVVVTYDSADVAASGIKETLRNHLWQQAFVEQRSLWQHSVHSFMFGHANYEMATKPYLGLTGKVLFIPLNSEFNRLSLKNRYQQLDDALCNQIRDNQLLKNNEKLSPMPFLGIPNWYDDNNDPQFYENIQYFRPKRRKAE